MDIDVGLVINLYKEKLSNIENELIISNAQVITLQQEIDKLTVGLKEKDASEVQ